jgi:hypothetical protein
MNTSTSIQWQLFPKSHEVTPQLLSILEAFKSHYSKIDSNKFDLSSNQVLTVLCSSLENIGFKIERSKVKEDKIRVPVLFGRNGALEKSFDADGFNESTRTVLEVEAGRAVVNNQFLKDLFQACMMHNVDNLVIAVRCTYKKNQDFEIVLRFFETLYASGRLILPLKNILIIGY